MNSKKTVPYETKAKVVILGPVPPPLAGVSVHVIREKELLETAGFRCSISPLGGWFENGITIRDIMKTIFKTVDATFNSLPCMSNCLHLHYSRWFYSIPILLASQTGRTPLAITFHSTKIEQDISSLPSFMASWMVRLLSSADLIIPVSERVGYSLTKLGIISRKKTTVIPAFLRPAEIETSPDSLSPYGLALFEEISSQNAKLVVASASNIGSGYGFDDVYGLELLVGAITSFESSEQITLLISLSKKPNGDKQIQAENRLKEASEFSTARVILVYGEPMLPFLSLADAYVRPSRIDGDSVAIREAISLGIPCGASNIVQRPKEVMLFELNIESLQTAITSLLRTTKTKIKLRTFSKYYLIHEIESLINY